MKTLNPTSRQVKVLLDTDKTIFLNLLSLRQRSVTMEVEIDGMNLFLWLLVLTLNRHLYHVLFAGNAAVQGIHLSDYH